MYVRQLWISKYGIAEENQIQGKRRKLCSLAVACHPILNWLSKIIRGNLYLLFMSEEIK